MGPITIFIPLSFNSNADLRVFSGSALVSLGIISIKLLSISLTANLTALIIESPSPLFVPVIGTSKPITIFSFPLALFKVKKRDFDRRFKFRDYEVLTGHLTGYYYLDQLDVFNPHERIIEWAAGVIE